MGSDLANTYVHIVSALMTNWLVRNDSRFGFMSDFQYISELLVNQSMLDFLMKHCFDGYH